MALVDLVRWMRPREERYYELVCEQATIAHEAALALGRLAEGGSAREVQDAVQALEHRGDAVVHGIQDDLARAVGTTPFARQDLQQLTAELDDVLDAANLAARACALLGVERPSESMAKMVDVLARCTALLAPAVRALRDGDDDALLRAGRAIHRLEKEGDAVFRGAISVLFHDPSVDAKALLREKEILGHLEASIDGCDHVGETLAALVERR